MKTRYVINWTLWIGLVCGIYCFLYAISPLNQYGVMWASFVSLPIYFIVGAPVKELPHFTFSTLSGVAWCLLYVFLINLLAAPLGAALSTGLVVGVLTALVCALHMSIFAKTWLSKVPAIFGGLSTCFSMGGANFIPLAITLFLGLLLALACNAGTQFLTAEGRWTSPAKRKVSSAQ